MYSSINSSYNGRKNREMIMRFKKKVGEGL
jgi:hypothetical protein